MKSFRLKHLQLIIIAIITTFTAISCGPDEPQFTISGEIKNAEGKTLYLSKIGLDKITVIDSVKLDEDGDFEFKHPQQKYFEFYRLSLKNSGEITLAVNGTEEIVVNANANDLVGSYTVSGSEESSHIREMDRKASSINDKISEMIQNSPPETAFTRNRIDSLVNGFKEEIANKYILPAPDKASAYYALYLIVGGRPLFVPYDDRDDSKCFAAVATRMQKNQPGTKRTKQICDTAKKGMMATRTITEEELAEITTEVKTTGHFNVALPDRKGTTVELASLKGKVVLLDFTFYENENMLMRNSLLDDLHMKYNDKGFEIYQISYDNQIHFWKTKAKDYPWVCVHDDKGNMSQYLKLYNISSIPTYFLINKENEVVLRDVQITDINKEIEKLLEE